MNLHFKVFLLSLFLVCAFSLKGIGLNPIKPYYLNQGKSTSYLFSISPEQEILTKAKVNITFPNEFDQSKIAANINCMASSASYTWKSVPCVYSNPSVIITLGTIKNEETDVLISQPVNPVIYTMSSYFSVCFMYDNTVTSCNKQFGKVVFPSSPINNTAANLTSLIQSLNSNTVGQASTYQFSFNLSTNYDAGNTIRVRFPVGFTTTASPICQISGTFNQIIKTFVWPDKRSIECQNINSTLLMNQTQVLKIIGIYNPQYAGTFGNTIDGFVIQVLKGTTTISLEQIYPINTITIQTGTLIGRIDQENNFIQSISKYTFYLNLQNALTSSNYIQMKFPSGWILYNGQCSVISGLNIGNRTLSCKNSTIPGSTIMNISNFESATVSNQIVLSLVVGTPSISGQYNVDTTTGNYYGVMDKMTTTVYLNSTYGTINMLSINAITANAKVAVGKTGPLEMTFFLNYELPQTNVLTEGKFIVNIYPQIPEPDPLINGVLKCYFFNNLPATTCIWNNTESASYTKLTITTPTTTSFQYSEIPITITTQGAVNDSMIGITIADVVTRYRFEMSAFKQDNATTPTEVYYTQYIADAIPLPLTTYSLTNQMNQYTHLRLQFVGPYDFSATTVQDIRFKIQFLNSGWASNLGYSANQIYKRFPCLLSENSSFPPTYNDNIACDLYTYLDGPHASLTDPSTRGPYILMYGFYPQLYKDYSYQIELPRLLIGSTSNINTTIRFSIIQQTPDMLTKYVELYYNEVVLFTTASTAAYAATNSTSVISNPRINVYSTHTNSFTVPTNGLAIIYEYDQSSTQSFSNQNFDCTTSNWCVSLGYPVNWIIQYAYTGTLSTSISSQFAITNGVYADTFVGKVRVFKIISTTSNSLQTMNIMTSIYKSFFTYIYTPSVPTSTSFSLTDTYAGMYKNMEQYYTVTFYPYTTTPSNGFVRLTLSSQMLFSANPYCGATNIPVLDSKLGLLCTLEDSRSTLKIYNIGGLSTGNQVQIGVRIATQLTSASTISPTVKIRTYCTLAIDTSLVDQQTVTLTSSPFSNQLTNPVEFQINNPKTVFETPRVNYIGVLEFKFRPSSNSLATPAAKIMVYFHDHPWNGGKFTTPNGVVADPLVCKLNRKRVDCTYTLNPMVVTMNVNPAGLSAGTDNYITLDTEYLAPDNGIKHPSQAGYYMTTLYFYDSSSNQLQRTSFTHQIKASKLRNLVIRSTVNDIGVQNMFKIWFETFSNLTVNANNHATLYSRIFIQFPTKDSLGNNLFASDLGGYQSTGQYVGCSFYYYNGASNYVKTGVAGNYMKCRLIKSQVDGDPVRVEIINHGAFTSSNRWMRVFIAKIFNPSIAVTSVPITIRIQHVDVATNNVYELYSDTYDVFMNSQNPTLQQANGTRGTRSNSFENGKNISDQGWFAFDVRTLGSVPISGTDGYYMAIDLTNSLKPMNNQNTTTPTSYCSGSYYFDCWIFPQINYIVVWSFSNNYYVYFDVKLADALSQNDTQLVTRVWQNGRFMGFDHIILYAANWWEITGTISSYSFTTLGNGWQQTLNRRRTQVRVAFRTINGIPAGGSIEIKWPSTFTQVYPNCRSMISQGSVLYAQGQNYNGQIGCMVQNTRSWVITSFQNVAENSLIVIVGQVDLPNAGGYIGTRYIYTYNNTHPTDIRTNGFVVDSLGVSAADIYINGINSWNADSQLTVQQTLPLRVNYVGPLQFKLQLNSNFLGPRQGRIVVRVSKTSTTNQPNGFAYVDKKYVCKIVQMSSNQQTGCVVQTVSDDNTNGSANIQFTLFSSSNLLSTNVYKVVITTQQGVQPQGLTFPSAPGTYKVSVSVNVNSNITAFNIYNQIYLEVYGTSFKVLNVLSFNTRPSEPNLIWIKLTPNTQILTTQQLIIEFPTISTAGLVLFQNDLGTGLSDGSNINVDIIGGSFSNTFMTCRLFLGDYANSKSTKIVCGQFSSTIDTTSLLFFAIKFNNPALNGGRAHISYPIFIYSMQQGKSYKKNFNVYDNAVQIRNDNGYNLDYVGDISSSSLQTPNGNIDMIARNYWNVGSGQYYILFFSFPLRNNGVVSNGCSYPNGGVYGDAYYHGNIWAIVCVVTSNTISNGPAWNTNSASSGFNTRNLRISGFYTPWYYLAASQRTVITYSYYTGDITTRGIFTDTYPNAGPKQASGPSFTMTPVHESSPAYAGSRDDYTFEIVYSSSATNDISYMKKVAIIFPLSSSEGIDFVLVGQDCVQATGSDVQIQKCWIDTNGSIIWIQPVAKTSYTSTMKIRIQTRNLAIRNPTNNRTVYWNRFVVKYYSWENITQPALDPINNNYYCFLIINNINGALYTTYALNPSSYSVQNFDYINYPHQRYFQQTPYQALTHRAPIQLKFRPNNDFIAQSSLYHNIKIYYPASFGDVAMLKIRDLEVFRPVCYLNNYRIRKCTIDTTNNFISMNFMFGLTNNQPYHIKVSLLDPRNPDINGFLASAPISNFVLTYQLAGQSTVYYMESDQFPTLFTLPTGITGGPFRSIIAGSVQYGNQIINQLNSINLVLTFNRTDITGLVFEIPLRDSAGNYLYPTNTRFTAAFLSLDNGATYPCGNHGFGAGGTPKCMILNGDNSKETVSTKIIMTDFTYITKMNCRFIFINPETAGAYFSVKVKAYGGTRSQTNLYGNLYMGEWNFMDIFSVNTGTVTSNSYSRNYYKRATQSPWRNNTSEYVWGMNYPMNSGRMSLAQLTLYDTSSSYTDKQFCITTLGSANDYDDLLQYTIVSGGITKKYAYFVTTWQTNSTNLTTSYGVGWTLSYIKCKFFIQSYIVYHFFQKNSIEVATNSYDLNYPGTYGSISSPIVKYFDQTRRFGDYTTTYFTMQIDFTPTVNSISNFQFRSQDSMVLLVTVSDGIIWNDIINCQLLGGILSTNSQNPAQCQRHSSSQIRIINVAGFQTNPLLPVVSNIRVKFMFKVDYLNNQSYSADPTKLTYSYLYANYDALSNGYQPIFSESSTLLNNCQYPNSVCYYSYGAGGGSNGYFSFDYLSDTSLRVTFKPYQNLGFGSDIYYNHYFRLQFHGFGYGATCSISSVIAQISTSTTPGSGTNNTLDFDTKNCNDHYIDIFWTADRQWADNWGQLGLASSGYWNNNVYIIMYIVVAPGGQDLPVMQHDYIFMSGTYNYQQSNNAWYDQVRATAFLPTQSLASSAVSSTLTTSRQAVTQLILEVKSLALDFGSNNTNYLLLAQFIGTSSWTPSADPFGSYVNTAKNKEKIECKCLSGAGPLSSSTTSPYSDAICTRRLPSVTVGSGTFTNYAILIDYPALKNNDIRCYFPEFFVTSGMSLNVKFKAVYGDSYPTDIISGTNQYYSRYVVVAPTVTFSGTTPSMSSPYVYGWNSLSDNAYSSVVTVGTKFSGIYNLSGNWNQTSVSPYIYINFYKGGPIPVFSFCSDSNTYFQCRVYSKLINVVVAKFKSSSVGSFTMTQGTNDLYYPPSQSSVSTFDGFVYIGATYWERTTTFSRPKSNLVPVSTNKFYVFTDMYGSSRYNYATNILISMNVNGNNLYNYLNTGSKIEILFSSATISALNNCQVWVQNEMSVQLTCQVSSGRIIVYSKFSDYSTTNNIFVSLGITNPNVASVTFTMNMYDYYYSATRYSMVISRTTTYATDLTYSSYSQLQKSRINLYPFKSRMSMTTNVPIRVRFNLPDSPGTISYGGNGLINIVNTQFSTSSSYLCYFKEYTSWTNMIQQTQHSFFYAGSCTSSTTTLSIKPPKTLTLSVSNFYELILMPIGITSGVRFNQAGFHQTNFEDINIVVYQSSTNPTLSAQQVNKLYQYEGNTMIGLQYIYLLTGKPGLKTSLYIMYSLSFSSPVSYPDHYIEVTLFDLQASAFVGYTLNNIIPCQLSNTFANISNRNGPQCRLASADTVNNFVKVRIENIGNLAIGNYWISLDDIYLPSVSSGDNTQKFDLSIAYYRPGTNTKYENFFKQIFVMDGTNTSSANSIASLTFSNPTISSYGSPVTGIMSFTWPFDSSASDYESKIAININGGYAASWTDISNLTFTDPTLGTYQILWINRNLNKVVFKIPNKSSGTATLTLNNIQNPYPYQQSSYNTNRNIEMNVYNNYFLQATQIVSQPSFSYFTKNPSIIYINQNIPTNTIDNYPSTDKATSNGLVKLTLSINFDQTIPNIILRQLDVIDIQFTSGLTYIDQCRAMKNDTTYINPLTTCQTYWDGTYWHVKLYDVTDSSLSIGWWVHVFAKFTSASLAYTFQISPKNLVPEYLTSYSTTLTSYDGTKVIPTQFSWLNRKYVYNFFENQVTLLQAVSGRTTPYFKFRYTNPVGFDGASDYYYIYLNTLSGTQPFKSSGTASNMICSFLPAMSSERDFTVGYYSRCALQNTGTQWRYHILYIHGGLAYGDYLFQVVEDDIIDSSFYLPTYPTKTLIRALLYRSQNNYNYVDSFFINTYRYFRAAEIVHTTTTVSDYDSLRITYTPQGSLSASSTNRQIVLRLSVHALYLDTADGGIKQIYLDDGISINTGQRFSQVVSNPNGTEVTTIQFSQYSNNMSPLRFSLARQNAYTDNVSYIWRLPLLKNPSTAYVSLRYNLTLLEYPSSTSYGYIFNHYEIINDYYTQVDTSASFTSSVINNLRDVQTVSGVDLSINLGANVLTWDSVTFKLDKSQPGLQPSFSNCNDTTNYNYYYFHDLQMVLAQKISSSNLSTVGINALSSTINYQSTFGFKWVRVFNSSNTKERFNPKTLKYSTPPTLTLNTFTTYISSSITAVQGMERVGSTVYYQCMVTTKIIPQHGEIRIMFDQTKFTSNIIGGCRVGTGMSKSSTENQVLRCYRGSNGFVVSGFSSIAASTSLQIFFYVQSLISFTNSSISADIYGVYRDNTTRISNSVVGQVSHASSSYPTSLQRLQQTVTPYYRSFYLYYGQNHYYEFQGTFILRSSTLSGSSDSLFITDPSLQQWGNRRMLIKLNSSTVTGWTEMTLSPGCVNQCRWYLPDNYINDLSIQPNQQYIWRYMTEVYNNSDGSRQNNYYFEASGPQRFFLKAHDGSSFTEYAYQQFIPKYWPISYTLSNRYPSAGKQTLLDLTFNVDIDLNTNDEIQLTFDTNNLLYDLFEIDLEGNSTNQTYRYLDCRQWTGQNNISTSRIVCLLYFGDRTQNPPVPAKLSIRTTRSFNGYPNIYSMRFLVANVKNPSMQNLNTGVELNVNRDCATSANQKCPYYTARAYYVTTSATQNMPATAATFSSNGNTVLQGGLTHTFVIPLTASLTTSGIIYIVYPDNFQGVMPIDCWASNSFTCYSFPTRRWIVLYPGTTYSGSTVTVSIWTMQNGYFSLSYDPRIKITVARPNTLGDVFYINLTALNPITSGISMTISATQTPQVWLRNYANTAIFYINYIFNDDRIKAIYIKAPVDVTSWTYNYCNASITGTLINTYPLRFLCQVDDTDSTFLKITRQTEQLAWSGSWASQTIEVHAQFTLAGFAPGQPQLYITLPNNSNYFYAYGSVNTTSPISNYYLTQTNQLISISQNQVPIISQITFDQQSFAYRVARVYNRQVFYLLLRPTTGNTSTIGQMVFKIPDQFGYPGVFSHDNCFMLGRTMQPQAQCLQSREAGQTLLKLTPTNYDQEVKIIQLGSKSQSNWFTAPALPGDFYNMTVQIYSTSNVLLEKQTVNISPVYGQYFDIPSIVLNNILETNYKESVYDLTFVTGTLQIPPGAPTTSTLLTSELQFVFENYNAANSSNVFMNDLNTGLKQGSQVGCIIRQGISALEGMRIKCILHVGTNSTDKPMIRIINYDYINSNTTVRLSFGGIQSLTAPLSNTISIGVKMYYNDARNSSTYLYILTPVLPKPTIATSLDSTRLNGWSWSFSTGYAGANIVLQPTAFNLRVWVPYWGNYSGYQYSSVGSDDQFVLLKFTPKFVIDPYNQLNITCSQCILTDVFYATGIVRFRHNKTLSGSWYFDFNFTNFPTSSYAILNQTVSVVVQIYDGYRRIVQSPVMSYGRTVEKCTKFDFGVLSVSSLNGGQINVEYLFSIKTNHYVPPTGAISISLPSAYGNMLTNNATCSLIGFQNTNVYCSINTPSRIDIFLNGSELNQNYSYKIDIAGLQNPNVNSSNLTFDVASYFDSDIYQNKKICENQITPPSINVKSIRDCTLQWQPNFYNMYFNATYEFIIGCSDQFRGNSVAYIQLPSQFSTRNKEGDRYCSSYESATLLSNTCTLKYINGSLYLYANLDATSQTSFSIITNFINPINNTYSASVQITSKGVLYAQTSQETVTILSNNYSTANPSDITLFNNPKEGGLMSTYIFKMVPITTFIPDNIALTFPNVFYLDPTQLNIGISVTDVSNLFQQLTYNNIQILINNVSSVAGVSLKLYPTFQVVGNTIYITNITNQLSPNLWTYVIVQGVKNPSKYEISNFTAAYYIQTVEYTSLVWIFNYPLNYFVSPPPNYLTIEKVQVSDYDLLYPSMYTFTFSSNGTNKVATAGKTLSYVIVIPAFYKSTLWANTAPVCQFANLATNSTCYSYESEIIVTETFTTNQTRLVLSISNILNPSLATTCNTTDVTILSNTFFVIRIIEVASNAFLFESSAVVDSTNCLTFSSLRIPITLQYSLIMVAGLAYNISYGLTKPASNLKINAYIDNQNGFTFSPSMIEFNDYYTLKKSTTVYLRSDIAAGTYTIKFNKYESDSKTYFRNILPITVTVIKADQTNLTRPTITINSATFSTIGYPVQVPLIFSMPSSTQMTFFITISQEANQTLQQYNAAFKDFSLTPRIISIKPQGSNYSFQIQHMQKIVPPPLTLNFKLTSLYPIIHNLTTQKLYLCFDQDPKFNVLEPPMRIRITSYIESCNNKDIGKTITNIMAKNNSGSVNKTVGSVKPVITNIQTVSILSTSANLSVSCDSVATVYYLCQPSGYPAITDPSVIKAMNATVGFTGNSSSAALSVYSGTASQINFEATIYITNLSPTSDYDIYVISQSTLGQSSIVKKSFKTADLSKGVVMRLSFKSIIDSLTIVQALQRILRISPMRIKVITSTYELQLLQTTITSDKNSPYFVYEIVIAPDPLNDVNPPQQIVTSFMSNNASQLQFLTQIPQWANIVPITYYQLKVIQPRVLEMPKPISIFTYNCTFSIKMWQKSNIYAVLIQQSGNAPNTLTIAEEAITPVLVSSLNTSDQAKAPSSNQIRSGLSKTNTPLNKYRRTSGQTDNDGLGTIFFDDLQPGTKYSMYITSSSILPYEPSYLWSDSQVITLSFTTLYNQALHNQEINLVELRKYRPSLADAIERFQKNQDQKSSYTKLTKS